MGELFHILVRILRQMIEDDITPIWIQISIFIVVGAVLLIVFAAGGEIFAALLEGSYDLAAAISSIVTGIATTALALVTGLYVHYTRKLVRENKKARQEATAPVFSIDFHGGRRGEVGYPVLVNAGYGPALDLNLQVEISPICKVIEMKVTRVDAGDRIKIDDEIFQELRDFESEMYKEADEVLICGDYETIFGEQKRVEKRYEIAMIQASAQASI